MTAVDVESPAARALRALQKLDEALPLDDWRFLIVEAQTALGGLLGLECTGEPDAWNADGSAALYSHDGATCPVHEWLVVEDQATVDSAFRR